MNYDETITTLQFASRAIKIRVNVHVNEKIEMKKIKEKLQEGSKNFDYDSALRDPRKSDKKSHDEILL
jgi:hypothetical protein